jgi:hypothetical protein
LEVLVIGGGQARRAIRYQQEQRGLNKKIVE